MVFYATAEGVVFEPLSTEAKRCAHDSKKARDRLSQKIALRRAKEVEERREAVKMQQNAEQTTLIDTNLAKSGEKDNTNFNSDLSFSGPESGLHSSKNISELEIRHLQEQLQSTSLHHGKLKKERDYKKFLADNAKFAKKGDSKALPANYVYQPSPADNAEKRAIVHHTGSHYHMAGSRQFQRGVRVKGVISRHSKQGAKMQAARVARRNMLSAREDARGERAAGGGKGVKTPGKSGKKKKKKKSDN